MKNHSVPASLRSFLLSEREVIFAFVCSRAILWALACFAYALLNHGEYGKAGEPTELWHLLLRWDANWYAGVVQHGYAYTANQESNVAFFPLYPLCIATVRAVTGGEVPFVGFVLSNLFLLAAMILLRRVVALDFPAPSRVPARTVWLLLLHPMTFFHSAMYTESLFLLLSIGAFLAARQSRWAMAGIAGALLTGTRANGLLILIPLFFEGWTGLGPAAQFKWNLLRARSWLLLVPMGLATFCAYLFFKFGDAFAFAHAMAGGWGRTLGTPWGAIALVLLWDKPGYTSLFIGAELVASALLVLAWILRLRTSYLLYAGAMLVLVSSTTLLEGIPRYVSVIFPFQIALAAATARSEGLYLAILAASTGLMAICLALFTGGYWMT